MTRIPLDRVSALRRLAARAVPFAVLAAAAVASVGSVPAPAHAQQGQASPDSSVQLLHVQGRVHMLVGAGANITVQLGDNAVVLVDSGLAQMSPQALAAIRSLSQKPIEFIINTNADADHTGGNHNLAQAGHFISGMGGERPGASIVSQIAVLDRMTAPSEKDAATPPEIWPTDTYDTDRWALFNDEAVVLEHPHAAHTDGDSIVFFRRSDVISAGDVFTPDRYPMIDTAKGGTINGEIDALNRLLELMVPRADEEGGTYVIPGHGRICDRSAVTNYRDMVTIVRDRIADSVEKGLSLEQVKAAKPTLDYDGLYRANSGPWTTDMFVEAVYRDLRSANKPPAQEPEKPAKKSGKGR
jgi:cyclase